MNYLSHLYFSQRTPLSMAGNLMGDFKREPDLQTRLPEEIKMGIENHKLVDRMTDHFDEVKQLKPLFSSKRRRFAGVILDISFDYYLIKHWDKFETVPFDVFVETCYQGLHDAKQWMPDRMSHVVSKMDEYDWLSSYQSLEGISETINHVSKRLRFKNKMTGGIEEVVNNYDSIESVFLNLFVHLREQVQEAAIETP